MEINSGPPKENTAAPKARPERSRTFLMGIAMVGLVTLLAHFLSSLVVIEGKHPLEATALAIIIGIIFRQSKLVTNRHKLGINLADKALLWGIVLLGFGLSLDTFIQGGLETLFVITLTMLVGFGSIKLLGSMFGLSGNLSLLLAVGTTICGGTAIAVTAPIIGAKEEETGYAIGTVTLWGVVAILIYPMVASYFSVSDLSFGLFAGAAIHSTPQVVAAGFIYSELAGKTATAVKLIRNCFIAPLSLGLALWRGRSANNNLEVKTNLSKSFPWFLFGFFLTAALNSAGLVSPQLAENCVSIAKWLILISMAALGLSVELSSFKRIGATPLLVSLMGTVIVAIVAGVTISFIR